ncbi:MAG: 50S ribosomal protein L6 [Planctomycetes bacterium]|nr:50S ribosomal protein L6 [Planctomycetota bacterium]
MSRIGKKPVKFPAGVKFNVAGDVLTVEGKLGKLDLKLRPEVTFTVNDSAKQVEIARKVDNRESRAMHGLTRAMVANMIVGVTDGYTKKLEIVGVGYLAAIQKNTLQLRVGFANEIHFEIPAGLKVTCPDQTHVVINGIDKQKVGQFAAEVRAARKPEPYKGKGVRYEGEVVRRKAGKAVTK